MGNKECLLVLDADKFPTYPLIEFLTGDKVLVRYYTREVWELQYDVAYHVVQLMGR